jgi:hypothetical protein
MKLARPVLVGVFARDAAPWQRRDPDEPDVTEVVSIVGIDAEGRAWGLVERLTKDGRTVNGIDRWIPVGNPHEAVHFPEDSDETDVIDAVGRWIPPVRSPDE